MKKLVLSLIVLLTALIFIPSFCQAKTTSVNSEADLKSAIQNATAGDTITLSTDIYLTSPIEITDKNFTINGNGHTISKSDSGWNNSGPNGTLITAGKGAKITLRNLSLKNSAKYGVQAYNGGYVILDGVTISNCAFGGVLANAGTVEVINLNLGKNGTGANNGIEIAQGESLEEVDSAPKLVMNGKLTSSEKENVVYLATNDNLKNFEVENTDSTEYKVLTSGNQVVIADENNNVLFTSNANSNVEVEGDDYTPNVTLTVHVNDKTVAVSVVPGTTLTEKELTAKVDLAKLGIKNYTIDGFYSDEKFTKKFDFSKTITEDTVIYAKLKENKKDNSPKTGVKDTFAISMFVLLSSITAVYVLTKKVK